MGIKFLESCEKKEVFCYGAGEYGRITALYLQNIGIKVAGFVVSKLNIDAPHEILSIPVYEIDSFPFEFKQCQFIVSMRPSYQNEIEKLLRGLGAIHICKPSTDEISYMKRQIRLDNIDINREGVLVLLYHRVTKIDNDFWKIATPPELFEKEIAYLKSNYHILNLKDDWSKADEKSVVITFDDGYVDNYRNAIPILEKYNVPATFYVCTGNIGGKEEFWWDKLVRIVFGSLLEKIELYGETISISNYEGKSIAINTIHDVLKRLTGEERINELIKLASKFRSSIEESDENRTITYDELKEMDKSPLVNIGGHTVSHGCMASLSAKDAKKEIFESKEKIERIIGHEILDFSYPFGGIADRGEFAPPFLEEAGYKTVATTAAGVIKKGRIDKKEIMRNTVSSDVKSLEDFIKFLDLTYAMSDGSCV